MGILQKATKQSLKAAQEEALAKAEASSNKMQVSNSLTSHGIEIEPIHNPVREAIHNYLHRILSCKVSNFCLSFDSDGNTEVVRLSFNFKGLNFSKTLKSKKRLNA